MDKFDELKKECICCTKSKDLIFFSKIPDENGNLKRDNICDKCKKQKFDFEYLRTIINPFDEPGFREVRSSNTLKDSRYKKYNMTEIDYNLLYSLQKGCCKICGISQYKLKTKLAVDHCHKTGKVRGLLCTNYNASLGLMKDNILRLENAIKYLKDSY